MSSSFSTLAKVATLFLSRYKCPGPPCECLRLARWDCAGGCQPLFHQHVQTQTCARPAGGTLRPCPALGRRVAEPTWQKISIFQIFGSLVVDIQLLLYTLCGGRGVSAAPNVCLRAPSPAPHTPPLGDQKAEGQKGAPYPGCPPKVACSWSWGRQDSRSELLLHSARHFRPETGLGALT